MSEATVIAVIGIVATLVGTLGGSYLTGRAESQRARDLRVQERRQALREVLTRVIVELREWGSLQHANNLFLAARKDRAEMMQYLQESVDSWSMTQLAERGASLNRSLTEAKLLVKDAELLAALDQADELRKHSSKTIFKFIESRVGKGEDAVVEAAATVLALQDEYNEAVVELESSARTILAERLAE